MSKRKPPTYDAPNQLAARIILADPERYVPWPEPLSVEEIEAAGLVRWALRITENQVPVEELKLT